MDEYTIYNYIRKRILEFKNARAFYVPITTDLIVQFVGQFGLDILKEAKLIEPTEYPGQWFLCCEPEPI